MKNHARKITIIAATLLLPMLLILPITQAKRDKKTNSKPEAGDASKASKANLLTSLPQGRGGRGTRLVPTWSKAAAFAVSPALRDLPPPVPEDEKSSFREGTGDERTINRTNRQGGRRVDPEAKPEMDGALVSGAPSLVSGGRDQVPNTAPPAPAVSFDGVSNADNFAAFAFRLSPPDTEGDVGPNHYVQSVNLLTRIYNKAGVALTPPFKQSTLFAALGGVCATLDDGDPITLYDPLADRWMISQFALPNFPAPPYHMCIAVSKTADPTGSYFLYDFVTGGAAGNQFPDYPKLGVWPDGYYMTTRQFTNGAAFANPGAAAFDREKMLAGDPTAGQIYFDLSTLPPAQNIDGMLPSDLDGLAPPPAGAPNVFSYYTATEFGDPGDALRLFNFHADFDNPGSSTFTERTESPLAVAAFDPLSPSGRADVPQPPPALASQNLDSITDFLMFRLQYRNRGGFESFVVNHTVDVSGNATAAVFRAGVRYYELRRTTGSANLLSVFEQATFAPADTENRWMGSAAVDNNGNLAFGYSVSSLTVFPSIRYAGKLAAEAPALLAETNLIAGTGVQRSSGTGGNRWGDYSMMAVDPADDCTFWYTQEYYTLASQLTSTVGWLTRVASFKYPTCTTPQKGTLVVNVINCDTLLPIQGASVAVDGTLYGSTGATGSTTSQHAPGTYSVQVSKPGFFPIAAVPATITNGNTTTINVCLTGMPDIEPAGATITAESCSPADNALSPGETVTVDFGLKNSGTAPTVNLVATLQATGGVTSPSGPQNYGAIPPDNTTVVTRPFTFTVGPDVECGDIVTATLDLQDGANNLGTATFTFNVGAPGAPITASYSSGNITTPIPDLATVDIPISVADVGVVDDINVKVRLNHTFDADLDISLVHPDGTIIDLSSDNGAGGDNYGAGANDCSGTPTVFDDEAATLITAGTAPFAGSFRPEVPLSAFDGKRSEGTWKLRITDDEGQDVGTVFCVTLEIRRLRFICCGVPGTPEIVAGAAPIINESCPPDNNAVDPGERVTVHLTLTNNGTGPTSNLVATLQTGGGVQSPSDPRSYGVLTPTGPGQSAARDFTFTAVGACGSTITATWQLQDGPTNLGTVSKTFQLGATVNTVSTFANATPIVIPATGTGAATGAPAAPYPSNITVAGLVGTVNKVTVKLTNFNHTFPSDVDVLLVGPGGQKLLLMSDVGGGTDAVSATLTFDDAAAAGIGATVVTGTFKPTNIGAGDVFPAPAPAGPYPETQLSIYNGVNPNGTWSLYVVDDAGQDIGNFNGGWELSITRSNLVCTTPCGMTRLVITSSMSCVSPNTVKVTFRAENTGTADAVNTILTTARLGTTTGSTLPIPMGTVAAGGFSPFFDVFFTSPTPGASVLTLGGTFNNGNFSSNKRVTVPTCGQAAPTQFRR